MTLTDLVSGSGASVLPTIALVILLPVFVVMLVRLFTPSQRRIHEHSARLPLNDEAPICLSPKERP